jgi:regulatory protein
MAKQPLSAKARALRWLSSREHTRAELDAKLARVQVPAPERQAVLEQLQHYGWVDDQRAAESLVYSMGGRSGSLKLRQLMRQRGVPADMAGTLLEHHRRDELGFAREVWLRKFGGVAPTEPAERMRQMRFLAARGFPADVVYRVVGSAPDEAAVPDPDEQADGGADTMDLEP